MKKYLIVFIVSFALGLLLWASMVVAKQTTMSTYYPSSGGQYSKVLLVNGTGGPDATNFCAKKADGTYGTPGDGSTFINAGTIFTDQYSGYMEICKSDGSVASYVGACLNRFSMDGTTHCPNHYKAVMNSGSPFPGATSYSCCFSNLSADATASNGIARSGCFSVFSSSNSVPAPCSSVDPNAYDMGCQCFQNGCSDVRTCCFNSGNGLSLQAPPSTCKTAAGAACPALSATTNGQCGPPITWGANSPANTCNGTSTYTPPICGGSAVTCSPVVVPCNDGNPCHHQICTNGICSYPNESDGTSCGINEYCLSGTCIPGCLIGGTVYPGGTVDSGNSCLSCQPATSSNSWSDVPNGTGCGGSNKCDNGTCCTPVVGSCSAWSWSDSGNTCNGTRTYTAPVCLGSDDPCMSTLTQTVNCNDGNFCHQQICSGSGTCSYPNVGNGTGCGSGNECYNGSCCTPVNGSCSVWTWNDSGNTCNATRTYTAPSCNGADDSCMSTLTQTVNCNDGNSCHQQICSGSGTCSYPNVPNGTGCGSGNECYNGTCCTPVVGSCSVWTWNDSGNTCNATRTYTAPSCNGADDSCMSTLTQTVNCNDGNSCHQQICSGSGTCSYPNVPNGTGCGSGNECYNGTCCTPVVGSCSVWTWNDSGNTCNATRTYTAPSCNGADDSCMSTLTQTVTCDTKATCSGSGTCTCNSGYTGAGTPGTCLVNECYKCSVSHCYVIYIAGVTYECAGPENVGFIYSGTDKTTSTLTCNPVTCNGSGDSSCTPPGCPMTVAYTCSYGSWGAPCGGACVPDGSCSGACGGGSGVDNCGNPCTNNTACTCTPDCAVNSYNCGSDGCGGSCGTCDTNATCSNSSGGTCSCNSGYAGSGTWGTCSCVPSCSGVSCGSGPSSCGSPCCNGSVVPNGDYCCEYMGTHAICPTGEPCNSSGVCGTGSGYWGGGCSDACGTCNPTYACGSTAGVCSISGAGCTATAGTCTAPQTCGGGGTANVCGCTPATCGTLGDNCDNPPDGCGGTLSCGSSCSGTGQSCGGGGIPYQCGCTPTTCSGGTVESCSTYTDGTDNCGNPCADVIGGCADICTYYNGGVNCGEASDGACGGGGGTTQSNWCDISGEGGGFCCCNCATS